MTSPSGHLHGRIACAVVPTEKNAPLSPAQVGERAILLLHGGRSGPTGAVFGDVQAVDVTRHLQRAMLSTIGASPASFGIDDRVLRDPEWPCPCVVDVDAGASEGPSSRFNHAAALVMPRAGTSLEDLQALVALPAGDRIQRWGPHGGLGARMYVFGGRDAAGTLLGDLWRLSVEEIAGDVGGAVRVSWEVVEAAGPAPPPAESAAMTAVGRKVFLLNGWSGAETCPWSRDCHVLDTASREWAALRFTDSPPDGRFLHSVSLADYRAASSAFSTVHGPALVTEASGYSISTQAGSQIELIVQARDALGAPAERSGAIFSVYLHAEGAGAGDAPSGVAEGDVRDLGLGLYKVALPVVAAGRFLLDIVGEDGASVQGCPLPVAVASGPPVPANAVLEGPGLEAGEVGKPREVFLTLHDALGNAVPMDDDALSRLAVRITGPAEDKRTLETELRGGRACIRYSTTQVGVCRLSIRYASREVPGSPVSVEMLPGPASRAQTRVSGRCIGGRWVANIPVAVTVQACDAFGNKLTVGGDAVAVAAEMISRDPKADPAAGSPRAGPRVVGEVTDYNDGTYGAMLALSDVGLYAVTVQISGADPGVVEGSPFFVRIMAGEIGASAV